MKKNCYLNKNNTLRDFVDLRDICSAIRFLMKKKINGVFNIASGKKVNLLNIYLMLNKNIRYNFKTTKKKNNILANINKIKNMGWYPKYNIFDILENFKKKI